MMISLAPTAPLLTGFDELEVNIEILLHPYQRVTKALINSTPVNF